MSLRRRTVHNGGVRILVVTTSSRRARWQVLERSILSVHPEAEVLALWCDARLHAVPGDRVLVPHTLTMDGLQWAHVELALGGRRAGWAALPWVVRALDADAATSSEPLIVMDDTFVVLDPLDALAERSTEGPVTRARHVEPATGAAWGGSLPGLVVLPPDRSEFLDWWSARSLDAVARHSSAGAASPAVALADPWWSTREGTVQLTDPAFRTAPDTAFEIEAMTSPEGQVVSDGRVISIVDFDGFDPRSPWWYPSSDGGTQQLVSESAGLRRLCHDQADRLLAAGWTPDQDDADTELFPGLRATPELRNWYRGLLSERSGADLPPSPYLAGQLDAFIGMLAGPGRTDGTGVSVHADLLYDSRADLRAAFPQPRWRDRGSFRRWLWTSGLSEGQASLATLPEPPRPTPVRTVTGARRPFGVNLVGYLDADLGLGVAARQMQRALEAAGVPTATISYDRTSSNLRARSSGTTDRPYHFNLMLIVPDQLPLFVGDVGAGFLEGHHNIGLWYWESDKLTATQELAFDHVDEVWAATTYLRDAFASAGRVPVALVPSPLVFPEPPSGGDERSRLGLDARFTYVFSFDFLSVVARKNPLGLVEAYRRAFPDADGDTRLILKSINGDVFPAERERLLDAIADRTDIDLWDRLLPGADRLALLAAADCYVSLHRSEGLGLTMAEAMAVGTPVVASSYSGNLDFMDDTSALLVPVDEVEVGPGNYYPADGHWAEPDLDLAATHLRAVRDDPALRDRLSAAGRRAIEPYSYREVGAIAKDRLVDAWRD